MPKPIKKQSRKRPSVSGFRVTDAERRVQRAAARTLGLSEGAFLRRAVANEINRIAESRAASHEASQ